MIKNHYSLRASFSCTLVVCTVLQARTQGEGVLDYVGNNACRFRPFTGDTYIQSRPLQCGFSPASFLFYGRCLCTSVRASLRETETALVASPPRYRAVLSYAHRFAGLLFVATVVIMVLEEYIKTCQRVTFKRK